MTFEEFTSEGSDASFSLQLWDNVLGSLGRGDTQDIHTARFYAGHTYTFTLSYFFITDPISFEVSRGADLFVSPAPQGIGYQTSTLTFVATETGTYALNLGKISDLSQVYDLSFVTDVVPQGTEDRDLIWGSIGNDSVDLAGGDDFMKGLAGNDTILGGTGNDRILSGDGRDSVDAGDGDDYIIGGRGADMLLGGAGRDKIEADDGSDTVAGGSGNDVIAGGNGTDMIYGGANNDRIYGGNGQDTLYAGSGNDRVWGGNGRDLIIAGDGRDLIRGGGGADTIISGGGDDDIEGGALADLFVFEWGMDEDVIWDFEDDLDRLDFSDFGFTQMSDLNIFQSGADAIVAYNHDWFLTLRDFDVSLLDDGDFVWATLL